MPYIQSHTPLVVGDPSPYQEGLIEIDRMGIAAKGLGVTKDYDQAVYWYLQAAALGDGWASNHLKELGEY